MLNLIISVALALVASSAPKNLNITVDAASSTVMLGEVDFTAKVGIEEYTSFLGEPTSHKQFSEVEDGYIFEDYGLTLHTQNGLVVMVTLTFTTDGDERFAQNAFAGTLTISGTEIGMETNPDELSSLKDFNVKCPIPVICAGKAEGLKLMAGFNEEDLPKLTQLTLMLD